MFGPMLCRVRVDIHAAYGVLHEMPSSRISSLITVMLVHAMQMFLVVGAAATSMRPVLGLIGISANCWLREHNDSPFS